MQAEEFLSPFPSSEPLLTALVSPLGSVFLLNDVVAARRGDRLLMIDVCQTRELSDRGTITPQLISMNHLWDVVFTQESGQERLRGFGIAVPPKQDVQHEAVLINSPPQPVSDAIDGRADFIQKPVGTPAGFLLPKVVCKQGAELDTPFAQRLVTDLDAPLVQSFLNISVAQWKPVVQPDRMLDDRHGESVAIGLGVGHGASAYPELVKATQPGRPSCRLLKVRFWRSFVNHYRY